MNTAFISILQKLTAEQGKEVLLNASKCKAFLADYTHGEYKKESRLLLQAIEAGVSKAIDTTEELEICKKQQTRELVEEHFLTEEASADVVDTLALVLREKQESKTPQNAVCKNCGKELQKDWKTCPYCETATNVQQKPAPAPTPSPAPGTQISSMQNTTFKKESHTKRNLIIVGVAAILLTLLFFFTLEKTTDSNVNSVAFSSDGRQIVSGSDDKTIKLWDASTGSLIRTFSGHTYFVTSVAFSPDGRQIVSGSNEGTIKLWDASTGSLIRTFLGHSEGLSSVAFSPDGRQILSGSWDNTIKLWDASTGSLIRTFLGHSEGVLSVAFSPDGRQIVSGSNEGTIKLWDASTGSLIRTFTGHTRGVSSVAFSPDGRQIVSGSYDETIKLWETATGKLIYTIGTAR